MSRVLAALVAVAMLSTSGSAAWQHVHAYVDHDHADHHHGPAAHGHVEEAHSHASEPHGPDDDGRIEGCGAGEHAVWVGVAYLAPHATHVPAPVALETVLVAPPEQAWRHVTPSDVRAHSPPRLTDAPLRAPPVVHLA